MLMSFFSRLLRSCSQASGVREAEHLYQSVYALSRQPAFYLPPFNVPDTLEGRFDLLGLLAGTLCLRLSSLPGGQGVSQQVFDTLFRQVELSLREAGTGDLSVPKHMRRMIQAFYGRNAAYADASDGTDLVVVLSRNIYADTDQASAERLARWVKQVWHPFLLTCADVRSISDLIESMKAIDKEFRDGTEYEYAV